MLHSDLCFIGSISRANLHSLVVLIVIACIHELGAVAHHQNAGLKARLSQELAKLK